MNGFLSRVFKLPHEQHEAAPVDIHALACKEAHASLVRSKRVFTGLLALFPDEKPGSKVIELDTGGRVVVHHVTPLEIGGSLIQGNKRSYLGLVDNHDFTAISLKTPEDGLTVVQFQDENTTDIKIMVGDTNAPAFSEACKNRIERIESLATLFGQVALERVA